MKIRDICVGITDGSHNPPQGIEISDYLMLSSKNVFDGKITFDAPRYLSQLDFEQEDERTKIKPGDVLLTIVGTVGRTAVVDDTMPSFTLQRSVAVLHPKVEMCNSRYLMYALQGKRDYIENHAKGVAQKGIYLKEVSNIDLRIPSIDEQISIVEVLDKVTSVIRARKQEIQKLDELIKSRFVEMFGDPVSNPKGWTMVPLGTRCEIITGNTPSRAEAKNYGEFIEWIKSDNINTPYTFLTKAQEYLSEIGFQKCRFVEAGSLLMTCIAGSVNCIGNVAVADRRVAFNQQINAIVPNEDEVLYLYWLMLLSKSAIHRAINMALKGILSKRQLSEMMFPFPPIALQKQFVTFVEQTDKSKLTIQKSLDELETLNKALMQKYFGGNGV